MASKLTLTEPALRSFSGVQERNLRHLEKVTGARVSARDERVTVEGSPEQVELAQRIVEGVSRLIDAGYELNKGDWEAACRLVREDPGVDLEEHFLKLRIQPSSKRTVVPKTRNQLVYVQSVRENDIAFGIGPAGTGKTYLAVALALEALREERVSRIVLTRPAVEAGERLGFLPGDIAAKVDPYLRPLYDAIFHLMERDKAHTLLDSGVIEVAPLAFMRGRTLNDSFNILDEAQNTTSEQMKMFLTRMGLNSKAVITGDITQIDLPAGKASGLVEASRVLGKIKGISFVEFTDRDVIRHSLVMKIVRAYEKYLNRDGAPGGGRG
jgi:phosphate starvation-inducible PhoH-like protein